MYGLKPTDIDAIAPIRGTELIQICIGKHDIQFRFHPAGNVSVWGRCELLDVGKQVVDAWEGGMPTGVFRFPDLLRSSVVEAVIDSPLSFTLAFDNGLTLRVIDNSEQHESFSVGNLYV